MLSCHDHGNCELCDELEKRLERADKIILMLTADHNTGPNYVKGFDMARDYFQDYAP
jgi:predicted DCC family thiol-disulfide oxidoreductase YuxK